MLSTVCSLAFSIAVRFQCVLSESARGLAYFKTWSIMAYLLCVTGCSPGQADGSKTPGGNQIQITPASPLHLLDLAGQEIDPFASSDAKWLVFIFVSVDCPISNRYAPEIRRLHTKFGDKGVKFWLVYPNADESSEDIAKHIKEYQYECGILRDPKHRLVKAAKVRVTPEAALFEHTGGMLYRGRIDNRVADFGRERPAPTERNLEDALEAALAGKPVPHAITKAVGCYIPKEP